MSITNTQEKKINRMNRASQEPKLGTIIRDLQDKTTGSLYLSGSTTGTILTVFQNGSGSAVKFGREDSYTAIEADGTLWFSGSATIFDDLVFPLTQTKQGSNLKPDFDETNVGYLFPRNDATEILYIIGQLPHGYKLGSDIYPHIHWRQSAVENPVFKIDYKWFNIGDPIPAAFSTYVMNEKELPYTSGSIHQISSGSSPITGTGKGISSVLVMKLYRDDNVYIGDALAFQFDIHVEKDSIGSHEQYVK